MNKSNKKTAIIIVVGIIGLAILSMYVDEILPKQDNPQNGQANMTGYVNETGTVKSEGEAKNETKYENETTPGNETSIEKLVSEILTETNKTENKSGDDKVEVKPREEKYVFTMGRGYIDLLPAGDDEVNTWILEEFRKYGINPSNTARVSKTADGTWELEGNGMLYIIKDTGDELKVYSQK